MLFGETAGVWIITTYLEKGPSGGGLDSLLRRWYPVGDFQVRCVDVGSVRKTGYRAVKGGGVPLFGVARTPLEIQREMREPSCN